MNRQNLQTRKIFKIFLLSLLISLPNKVYADDVRVYLNNERLEFEVEPIIIQGTTFVPMRAIFESLGADVGWDGKNRIVTGKKDDLTLTIDLNKDKLSLNSRVIPMKQSHILKNGRTLVPLRVISESFDSEVSYERKNGYADIHIRSKAQEATGALSRAGIILDPSMKKDGLIRELGKPSRIDYYDEDISLYVYNNSKKYDSLIQFLVNDQGDILKIETFSSYWSIDGRIRVGEEYNKSLEDNYNKVLKDKDYYIELGKSFDNKISYITLKSKYLPRELWYKNSSKNLDKIMASKEQQIFDYTNSIRVNKGFLPFERESRLDKLAKAHSVDMYKKGFMAHTNMEGLKGVDRFNNLRTNLKFGGENLCAGYLDPAETVNALYNSKGHRANMLNNSQYMGIGIGYEDNSKYKIYMTQVYGRR